MHDDATAFAVPTRGGMAYQVLVLLLVLAHTPRGTRQGPVAGLRR